jgi:hypothetical protein
MEFDIRLPIGLLFAAIGGLLMANGLVADPAVFARHSLGVNINLAWGAAMALIGALMLAIALRARQKARKDAPSASDPEAG